MIRVLHCVVGMNYGGYEAFIMNVYRNIDRKKVQFDFLTSLEGVYDNEIINLGGTIYRIPFITKVGPFSYNNKLEAFIKEHPEYKIIHSHMDKFSGMIMRATNKHGVPVRIAHSHNTQNEGGIAYQLVKNYYGKMINRYCSERFACSDDAGRWMFGTQPFTIVNNGIDVKKYIKNEEAHQKIRTELAIKDRFVVGHVGRFSAQKNHEFLLDIFAEIKKLRPNATLLLVGAGELRQDIAQKAKTLGLDSDIIFYGLTDKVEEVLQAMDVFVFPSLHEGLGIVLVEAQCAGLYCIASDSVPAEANFSGNVEFLSLEKKPTEWAACILKGSKIDADIVQKAANAGYDIPTTANFLQNYYLNCTGEM